MVDSSSTQIINPEMLTFVTFLVFKLLSRKVLFINRKDNKNCGKVDYFFKKIVNFTGKLLQNYK